MEPIDIKILLKNILRSQKIQHKIEIMKEKTIKNAHMYCKIHNLSGQIAGPLIEYFIKNTCDMTKNISSLCNGDLKHNNIDYEIKISNGGQTNDKFNYVQLRMNHVCNYIFTAYYLDDTNIDTLGELFIFKLTKDDIKSLILNYGHYAHGNISKLGQITEDDLNDVNNNKEYALRPKYNDKCWNALLQFRIDCII